MFGQEAKNAPVVLCQNRCIRAGGGQKAPGADRDRQISRGRAIKGKNTDSFWITKKPICFLHISFLYMQKYPTKTIGLSGKVPKNIPYPEKKRIRK